MKCSDGAQSALLQRLRISDEEWDPGAGGTFSSARNVRIAEIACTTHSISPDAA